METRGSLGFSLIKIASIYMVASLAIGFYMGVTHVFTLLSVHSHIGLLGWVTMALAGLVYVTTPRCTGNRLAHTHFWLHNLGLPIMISGLVWNEYSPGGRAEAVIGIGSSLVVVALLFFAVNLFKNGRDQ